MCLSPYDSRLKRHLSYFDTTDIVNYSHMATSVPYLLSLGPNYVLEVGGKALTDPFLSPVLGTDNQTKPGMGNLMAYSGPTQRQTVLPRTKTSSIQHTLGQENHMRTREDRNKDRNKGWKRGIKPKVHFKREHGLEDRKVKQFLKLCWLRRNKNQRGIGMYSTTLKKIKK